MVEAVKVVNEHVVELVTALRGDQYQQGTGYLRPNESEFCCLGVACDLFHKAHPDSTEWVEQSAGRYEFRTYGEDGELVDSDDAQLPFTVMEWLGWRSPDGRIAYATVDQVGVDLDPDADSPASLAALNDQGVPFAKIADVVEVEWGES